MFRCFSSYAVLASVAALCACSAALPLQPFGVGSGTAGQPLRAQARARSLQTPALLGITFRGVLKDYPIRSHGSGHPQKIGSIPHVHGAAAMAADGNTLVIATQHPAGIVRYDIATHAETALADPYGTPIDVAIDANANVFALNYTSTAGNVTMYAANSSKPVELKCSLIGLGEAIAADDEGDVFVNGYPPSSIGVVEIPRGPHGPQPDKCKQLTLLPEQGYVAGIGVDPKTDDLIVLDDPDECAGSDEGRMTIYSKPYQPSTGHSVVLHGNCVGRMRLNATSTKIFTFDETVSGGVGYVTQHSYPGGIDMGSYRNGDLSGITTIPNTLPN